MELIEVSEKAMRYYRKHVEGNKDVSDELIRKKLTRNIMLAKFDQSTSSKKAKVYWYGQLKIVVVDNKIVKLQNCKGANTNWTKDEKEYKRLNKLLGIPNDHSLWYRFKRWLHKNTFSKLKFT